MMMILDCVVESPMDVMAESTCHYHEYVSAIFARSKGEAAELMRLLKAAGVPAKMDMDVESCVAVLVPDGLLDVATEIISKKKKDVEEEEDFDEEEDEDEDLEDEDGEDEDDEFEEDEFEEEFEDDELDDDEDDIFYDDEDDE